MDPAEEIRNNLDLTYVDLSRLSGHKSVEVKEAVANHPNTSGATLHALVYDYDAPRAVVEAVINNPKTGAETYEMIHSHVSWDLLLAQSERTPAEIMKRLAHSNHLKTRDAARAALGGL